MSQSVASSISSLLGSKAQQRLDKIHTTGYWRITVRPTVFNETLIPTLSACRDIVRNSAVALRGWDYPHWKDDEIINGQEWIEGGIDWSHYVEYWRYYQSGQFVHHFALREDYDTSTNNVWSGTGVRREPSYERFLDITSSVYTLTEIYEFAARLAAQNVLSPKAEMSVGLVGTEGRLLTFAYEPRRVWGDYRCQMQEANFTAVHSSAELLARASDLALDAAVWIFERFNWVNVPRNLLADDQRKLLERRL